MIIVCLTTLFSFSDSPPNDSLSGFYAIRRRLSPKNWKPNSDRSIKDTTLRRGSNRRLRRRAKLVMRYGD